MGERIAAGIRLGGKLYREDAQSMVDALNAEGLLADWCDGPTLDNLGSSFADGQVNYGNLDEIEALAQKLGLDYVHWFESGSEWDAGTVRYIAATGQRLEIGGNDQLMLTKADILRLGTMEAVLAYFDKFTEPLPAIEIV